MENQQPVHTYQKSWEDNQGTLSLINIFTNNISCFCKYNDMKTMLRHLQARGHVCSDRVVLQIYLHNKVPAYGASGTHVHAFNHTLHMVLSSYFHTAMSMK